MPRSQTVRDRIRVEVTKEILHAAALELAEHGADGLSLRAVARRVELAPSALYRYFDSREALLTALIIEAYESVGAAADEADPGSDADPLTRWLAVASTIRTWAGAHPHEWALIYGSPVPGYRAPADTVEAALRITRVLARIFADALPTDTGRPEADRPGGTRPPCVPTAPLGLEQVVKPLSDELLPGRAPEVVVASMIAWTQVLGMVSLELFGHFVGATTDFDQVFAYAMQVVGTVTGLAPNPWAPTP